MNEKTYNVSIGEKEYKVKVIFEYPIGDVRVLVARGEKGEKGENGQDGFSPIVKVSKIGRIATITVTDKKGTTFASVSDGTNGTNGRDGTDGTDGFSPIATVTKVDTTATISITDKNGTTTASVSDGTNGTNGRDGTDGTDGFSPIATVSKSGNAVTISITDKNGTTSESITDSSIWYDAETKIGTWTDGKDLYRKIVTVSAYPNSTGASIPHSISNIDRIVNYWGIATSSNGQCFKLPYATDSSSNVGVQLTVDKSNIYVMTSTNRSSQSGWVVIEYTKTS